jgi:anti-anti-sigma regulatory factor
VKLNKKNGEMKSKNIGEDTLFFDNENIRTVIIDCAPLNYIDTYAVKTLNQVHF